MKVAVIHEDINAGGGAEAVLANTLQAVQHEHDTTLFTVTECDINSLNNYHGTSVDPERITVSNPLPSSIDTTVRLLEGLVVRTLPITKLKDIKSSIMKRHLGTGDTEHDVFVCTQSKLSISAPSVNYVHFPFLSPVATEEYLEEGTLQPLGRRLQRIIERHDPNLYDNTTLITNSSWTANIISEVYDASATVVNPPIDASEFDPQPWGEREDGFVTVGRVVPSKRHDELIGVLDSLVNQGVDTHLHIVGGLQSTKYCKKVRSLASERPYISVEESLPREELCTLLNTHKYGLHGMEYEHFGMVVAEMRTAGMLPFVHDSGGQVEIVNERPELLYCTFDKLVEKLRTVMTNESLQHELRDQLMSNEIEFTAKKFRTRMRSIIEQQATGQSVLCHREVKG